MDPKGADRGPYKGKTGAWSSNGSRGEGAVCGTDTRSSVQAEHERNLLRWVSLKGVNRGCSCGRGSSASVTHRGESADESWVKRLVTAGPVPPSVTSRCQYHLLVLFGQPLQSSLGFLAVLLKFLRFPFSYIVSFELDFRVS